MDDMKKKTDAVEQESLRKQISGYNLSDIIANIEQVKKIKAERKKKEPSKSIRPMKFEISPEDSPLKAELVRRINAKNLTYGDLHAYCAKLCNGDIAEGRTLGNNIITGLRNRHSFTDKTLSIIIDFLNLDIILVERPAQESVDDKEDGEEN